MTVATQSLSGMKVMDRHEVALASRDAALVGRVIEKLKADRNPEAIWDAFRAGWIDEAEAKELLDSAKEQDTRGFLCWFVSYLFSR